MVSYFGTFEFKDLVQTYDLYDKRRFPPKEKPYDKNSIMGFMTSNPDFTLFSYIFKTAELDRRADEQLFQSTLFLCPDSILKQKYKEEFFMNLDRNTALSLLNNHILPKPINERTLLGRRVAILDTRNKESTISLTNNKGKMVLNNEAAIISHEIQTNNGIIYIVDSLLPPQGFFLL